MTKDPPGMIEKGVEGVGIVVLNNYICGIKRGIVDYMRWNDRQIRAAKDVSHRVMRISRRALFSYKSAIYQSGGGRL